MAACLVPASAFNLKLDTLIPREGFFLNVLSLKNSTLTRAGPLSLGLFFVRVYLTQHVDKYDIMMDKHSVEGPPRRFGSRFKE